MVVSSRWTPDRQRPLARSHMAGSGRRCPAYDVRIGAMSEYELRDIGLTRSDVNDATAFPLDADPSGLLVRPTAWRERTVGERADLAA